MAVAGKGVAVTLGLREVLEHVEEGFGGSEDVLGGEVDASEGGNSAIGVAGGGDGVARGKVESDAWGRGRRG